MRIIANKVRDVKGGGGGPAISVTMTLIFPKIVWTCPLTFIAVSKFMTDEQQEIFIPQWPGASYNYPTRASLALNVLS